MVRLAFVVLLFVAILLAVTNPGQEAHRKTVYASLTTQATNSPMLGRIAVDVLGDMELLPLEYHNYFLFSTTTLKGRTRSVGALSRVWEWK